MQKPNSRPSTIPPEALQALQQGNFIAAVKITRQQTGLGLKESKDLLDAYLAKNPSVQQQIHGARGTGKPNGLVVLFVLLLSLALIIYVFLF